jgi:predicted amidohydrolase
MMKRPILFSLELCVTALTCFGCAAFPSSNNDSASAHQSASAPAGDEMNESRSAISIAFIKTVPEKRELERNFNTLMDILAKIERQAQVDVVITPEGFLDGYVSTEDSVGADEIGRYAIDPRDSPYTKAVSKWAARNGAWVIFCCIRRDRKKVFNTALIYDRQGRLVGWYDKLHLQNHDLIYTPGDHLDVYDCDFGKFGVMICADRRWPETVRTLRLKGARIIFNPTYGFHNDLNTAIMRTRSFENEIAIAFCHPKHALLTGPIGKVHFDSEDEDLQYCVVDYDLSGIEERRRDPSSHVKDRRQDVYDLK